MDTASVLITGGCGFLGSHVARVLAERGQSVVLYDQAPPSAEVQYLLAPIQERVSCVRAHINDLATLVLTLKQYGIRQIVHAAALIDAQFYMRQPYTLFKVNVEGTIAILEAARLERIERVVYISSVSVFPAKRYDPLDEEHTILDTSGRTPSGPYGTSKAASELFGVTYAAHGGAPFIAQRFATIYGFGMRQPAYIKPMVENAVRGLPTSFTRGAEMRRSFIYVKDCTRAVTLALDADLQRLDHRVFNVCREETVTIAEAADVVRELVPGTMIQVGPGLTEYERMDITRRGAMDVSRARREFGFEAIFDLRQGIADYVRDYRDFLLRGIHG